VKHGAFLSDFSVACALGVGAVAVRRALFDPAAAGLASTDAFTPGRFLAVGRVEAELPAADAWPITYRSRNNRLFALVVEQLRPALDAACAKYGAHRVGCVLGTSTSGIGEAQDALSALAQTGALPQAYHYAQQNLSNPAEFIAWHTGLRGPTHVVSTACSSSAKALASAARLLELGLVDVVLAGGVDSLCTFTIAGFSALESVSAERCNPLSANRKGINIGEAAAFFLVTREGPVRLAGWGETSDGHHMSAPEPSGAGAKAAIEQALRRAGVRGHEVGYVNLHGTATPLNDSMESRAVAEAVGLEVPVSSTKPLTGHTLGAAGALEAGLAWLTMVDNPRGQLPPHLWDGARDPALPALQVVTAGQTSGKPPRAVLSNSFAFGGNNAALVFTRE
jgi:3-oxoacyl-[acyl-carrier-protein] synthase-1